jgi:hypothetical protein
MNGSPYFTIVAMANSTQKLTSAKFYSTVLSLGHVLLSL